LYLFYRYGFYQIPQFKTTSTGAKGQLVQSYIKKLRKHGFNVSESIVTRRYIAYHHWHKAILLNAHNIRKEGQPMKIPLKISSSIAASIDIPKRDMLEGGDYFNIPSQNEALIRAVYDDLISESTAETCFSNVMSLSKILKSLDNNTSIQELLNEDERVKYSTKKRVLEKIADHENAQEIERQHKSILRKRAEKKRKLEEAISNSHTLVR
jgi:hypothetical protein